MIINQLKKGFWILLFCFVSFFLIIGSISQTRTLTSTEADAAENVLRVGVSTDAPPLIYKQGKNIIGLEAEFAQELAKFLGKSLQFIEVDWKDQIPALLDNKTDIIMSGMSITRMREVRIAFSEPYFRTGQMALIRERDRRRYPHGYYSILGWTLQIKIGVVKATTGEFFVRKHLDRAKAIIPFSTSREAAKGLIRRRVDLVIHDAPMIIMLAAENETEGLIPLPGLLTEEYLAWGIRKNDVELLKSANRFIETMKNDGRLNSIINRWIPVIK